MKNILQNNTATTYKRRYFWYNYKHADKLHQLQTSGSVNNVATESGGGAYVSSNVVSIEQMTTLWEIH
jgi:hypothetical protein